MPLSQMLISVEELRDRLDGRLVGRLDGVKTLVFDCRFSLQDTTLGRAVYMQSHIPFAHYLDLEQDLSAPKDVHGGRHPLPAMDRLVGKLTACGVTPDTDVVVYDAGEGMATRAWWLVRYLGHERVSVLDGGWNLWVKKGFLVTDKVPEAVGADGAVSSEVSSDDSLSSVGMAGRQVFLPNPHYEWIVDVDAVDEVSRGEREGILLDARAKERYRGDVEPLDPKAGHIPGAINAPWQEGVDADGRWLAPLLQRERFSRVFEEKPAQTVIAYCGSGVTACANLFALELAGIRGAKLYPGSWSDWCSYPELPIETGNGHLETGDSQPGPSSHSGTSRPEKE